MIDLKKTGNGVTFNLRVVPNSSKSEIVGEMGGALKVKIAASPTGGAANIELIRLLAKTLGIPKTSIEITIGQSSKNKQVKICGINPRILTELFGK